MNSSQPDTDPSLPLDAPSSPDAPDLPTADAVPDVQAAAPAPADATGEASIVAEGAVAEGAVAEDAVAESTVVDSAGADAAAPNTGAAASPRVSDLAPAACAAALAERFPALFGTGAPLPVKLRIHADIQERAPGVFTRKSLSMFLHRHTTSTAYIKALLAASTRFDLDGQPAGDIAEEHRAAAAAELDRRKAIVQEKRAAQHRAGPGAQRQAHAPGQPLRAPVAEVGAEAGPGVEAGTPDTARPRPPQNGPRPNRPRPEGRHNDTRRPADGAPDRAPRGPRANLDGAGRAAGGAAGRPVRAAQSAGPRPSAPQQASGRRQEPRMQDQATPSPAQPQVEVSADPARRERGALLRAFEGSTLTKANFLVLKRMTEADLDAQLAQARQERQEWQTQHPAPPRAERAPGGPGRR